MLAGTAGTWLERSRAYVKIERYLSGGLFVGLGCAAALTGGQQK